MSLSPKRQRNRRLKSCTSCHQRKVKCDRQHPCSECVRKGQPCLYAPKHPLVSVTGIQKVVDRMVIEMDIYKQLETYWRQLAQNATSLDLPDLSTLGTGKINGNKGIFSSSCFSSPFGRSAHPFDVKSRSAFDIFEMQAMNVLDMFSASSDMTTPHFKCNFNPKVATTFWKLLTRPIHVELMECFDSPDWNQERRILRSSKIKLAKKTSSPSSSKSSSSSSYSSKSSSSSSSYSSYSSKSSSSSNSSSNPSPNSSNIVFPDLAPLQLTPNSNFYTSQPPVFVPNQIVPPASPSPGSSNSWNSQSDSSSPSSPFADNSYNDVYQFGDDSYAALDIDWSFPPNSDGLFEAPSGRKFDAISDFLYIRSSKLEDIVTILEYAVAFLRGTSFLDWTEVGSHIAFNCERILHFLLIKRKADITYELADRIITCINLFAFQYEYSGKVAAIGSYLLLAHQIAAEHGFHSKDPIAASRIDLCLLWWTKTVSEREEYTSLIKRTFADLPGIDWRWKLSYVACALRSQKPDDPCVDGQPADEFWETCSDYLRDAESVLPVLSSIGIPPASVIFFHALVCPLRAELGPRIGNNDAPIEQSSLMINLISSLEDTDTYIVVDLLIRSCKNMSATSATFYLDGTPTRVCDYLVEQLSSIPTMPIQALKHGTAPHFTDIMSNLESEQNNDNNINPDGTNHTTVEVVQEPAISNAQQTSLDPPTRVLVQLTTSSPFQKEDPALDQQSEHYNGKRLLGLA